MLSNRHNITGMVDFSEDMSGCILGYIEAVLWRERPIVMSYKRTILSLILLMALQSVFKHLPSGQVPEPNDVVYTASALHYLKFGER